MNSPTTTVRPAWAQRTAKDVMVSPIVSATPTSSLPEVERLLTKHRISGMPVVDASGRPIGVVSYRDLLDRPMAARHARDVMTPAIVDVSTEATIEEVCRTMVRNSVHRVLVTDTASGRIVGIVSSLDVLAAIAAP